jgi:anthranilate phosphoribosyltransferase
VAANAGVAISVAKNVTVRQGVEEALDIINQGRGIDVLDQLIN